jgi:hypothetical protein
VARGIPVGGPMGADESFGELFWRYFNVPGGCLLNQDRVGDTGQLLLSRLDVTQINPAATESLGGKTVYGDAILFRDGERFGLA